MRVLVLPGDIWHSAEVPRAGLQPLRRFGFEFDWIENAKDWSAERMGGYPVVILAKANTTSAADRTKWMSTAVQRAFLDYVESGNGLLVLHAGAAVQEDAGILRELIGGCFLEHPEQCPVNIEPHRSHALAAGCEPFEVIDEHYFMQLDDQSADVFVSTTSEHGSQPGGWFRSAGRGRVCVLTPGHNLPVWQHPGYQQLLLNTLRCCGRAGESVPTEVLKD